MCGGPQWKREVVPDHKFDFVDTRDFTDHSCWMRTRYMWVYVIVLKSFLVYVSDIFTAITMLTTQNWSNRIFQSCNTSDEKKSGCVFIPFVVGKWLFVGCIIFSFLLLAYETRKAKKIIASRDISYAFTNILANNYYSLRSYDHFCFFCQINNSTKKKDDFAFFIFFTFKSWKRLLLADGPRQVINGLTLYSFYLSQEKNGPWYDLKKYTGGNVITTGLIFSTLFTVVIFIGSALLLLAAGLCYIPLLCYIRGNLKEYCCHKVDKRIAEIVKRKNKERLARAAALAKKEAAGDFSHLKNKKGEFVHNPLPQPTLPNVTLDDEDDSSSMRKGPSPSTYTAQSDYYYNSNYNNNYGAQALDYPPTMPQYHQHQQYYQQGSFAPSVATLHDDQRLQYDDEYSSQAHLPTAAAPFARHESGQSMTTLTNPYEAPNAHAPDMRGGGGGYPQQHQHADAYAYDDGALAYDDGLDYPSPNSGGPSPHHQTGRRGPSAY
ncbi:hypothetical protein BD410DRAFT_37772 [Rickenella mellea]|uniref:Vacuole protein n=1 Tax=Rickenella mellea TaxID=50990 RepID=A0A4R5XEY9_9AGAM|nr:hypothetical protein BD410DRAFT_37772 [Rickenella mellea]